MNKKSIINHNWKKGEKVYFITTKLYYIGNKDVFVPDKIIETYVTSVRNENWKYVCLNGGYRFGISTRNSYVDYDYVDCDVDTINLTLNSAKCAFNKMLEKAKKQGQKEIDRLRKECEHEISLINSLVMDVKPQMIELHPIFSYEGCY